MIRLAGENNNQGDYARPLLWQDFVELEESLRIREHVGVQQADSL